jgi:hypothetical protein
MNTLPDELTEIVQTQYGPLRVGRVIIRPCTCGGGGRRDQAKRHHLTGQWFWEKEPCHTCEGRGRVRVPAAYPGLILPWIPEGQLKNQKSPQGAGKNLHEGPTNSVEKGVS